MNCRHDFSYCPPTSSGDTFSRGAMNSVAERHLGAWWGGEMRVNLAGWYLRLTTVNTGKLCVTQTPLSLPVRWHALMVLFHVDVYFG